MSGAARTVCLGVVGGAHGVRGEFRIRTFTQVEEDVAAYGPVTVETPSAGSAEVERLSLQIVRVVKPGVVLAKAPEVPSREAVAPLTGKKLFVDRTALPDPDDDDEFYVEDLVGLEACLPDGAPAGIVAAVHDFGAGDLIELWQIPGVTGSRLIRFTRQIVPRIDLAAQRIELSENALDEGEGEQEPSESSRD
ncbi:MAG: 16S rRNA processing protein RimM [Alphaproteobacteria bacterium]|nr:16S rRNA processing protein RimM [Alphaproteobacteria bacterium]